MECKNNRNKTCDECNKFLAACDECKYIDGEGDCNNHESRHCGEFMEGLTVCCSMFDQSKCA